MNIRMVSDFETGKPKGFAFVEYEDAATALSAIRNLNGFECNGRPVCALERHSVPAVFIQLCTTKVIQFCNRFYTFIININSNIHTFVFYMYLYLRRNTMP